jgi:succinate dehydrogenase/fumarate reductase cytochrome b subunit
MGQPMLTADELGKSGKACIDLHDYYRQNYESGLVILVLYKDCHFLVGVRIFMVTFSNLYDLFNLNTLDMSLMRCFAL